MNFTKFSTKKKWILVGTLGTFLLSIIAFGEYIYVSSPLQIKSGGQVMDDPLSEYIEKPKSVNPQNLKVDF